MKNFCLMLVICLTSSVATADSRTDGNTDDDWPPYYKTCVLKNIQGKVLGLNQLVTLPKGFVFHRLDVEKIYVIGDKLKVCNSDLKECENRPMPKPERPGFFSTPSGKLILFGIGFVVGAASTVILIELIRKSSVSL